MSCGRPSDPVPRGYNDADASMSDSEIIFDVGECPEGGYEARALGHSIVTQADSIDELKAMVKDAVRCHFDESERPRVILRQ